MQRFLLDVSDVILTFRSSSLMIVFSLKLELFWLPRQVLNPVNSSSKVLPVLLGATKEFKGVVVTMRFLSSDVMSNSCSWKNFCHYIKIFLFLMLDETSELLVYLRLDHLLVEGRGVMSGVRDGIRFLKRWISLEGLRSRGV